jgi:uncharacterized protein involved in exopolysaccharide biosynthesis
MKENKSVNSFKNDDSINFLAIYAVAWGQRKLILACTTLIAVISLLFAIYQDNIYKSEAIFLVKEESSSANVSSSLGGLASFAGIRLPSGSQNKSDLIIETIKSREFFRNLSSIKGVLPGIYAPSHYSPENETLYFSDLYDTSSSSWLKTEPNYLEAHRLFQRDFNVELNKQNGFIYVSYEHKSPIFASNLLQVVLDEIDKLFREKDMSESTDALSYLKSELISTKQLEVKQSINQLIKAQLETQMISKISENYILDIVEPPFVPDKKYSPNRALLILIATIAGFFTTVFLVLIFNFLLRQSGED